MTSYEIPDGPKMLRETLCVAQVRIGESGLDANRVREHVQRLQRLINECDRHRPLGPDGKHGDRHTRTCGCDATEYTCDGCQEQADYWDEDGTPRCNRCEAFDKAEGDNEMGRAGGADLAQIRCVPGIVGGHVGCDHDPDRATTAPKSSAVNP